jgi:hypothetical protein
MDNNVQFVDENAQGSSLRMQAPTKGIASWLIRKGWAKNRTQANVFLIAVIIACIVISVVIASSNQVPTKQPFPLQATNPNQ